MGATRRGRVCGCVGVVVRDDKWELQGGGGYVDVWVWWLGMISGSYKEGEGVWVWWLGMISGSYKEGEGMCVCVCVCVCGDCG